MISNVKKLSFTSSIVVGLLLALAIPSVFAAQDRASQKSDKASSISSIISLLLLDESEPVGPLTVTIGELISRPIGYQYGSGGNENGLELRFEGNGQDLTICFDTVDIQVGELSVELNGQSLGELTSTGGQACFDLPAASLRSEVNVFALVHNRPGERWGVRNIVVDLLRKTKLGLPTLTRQEWTTDAVRKVLKIFAFGGHATDRQIQIWANADPATAITEMLNFSQHNPKLSPLLAGETYPEFASVGGTFTEFSNYLASNSSRLPFPLNTVNSAGVEDGQRRRFAPDFRRHAPFIRMVTTRGLNPFRQFVGYWETNYHLAVSIAPSDGDVPPTQLTRYYDVIMQAHESGVPYQEVLAEAAKSAAIAHQYGHQRARWDANAGVCLVCNEDFAREIHQLFFGIFGLQDPLGIRNHEEVTIPQTSHMLTGMQILRQPGSTNNQLDITFSSELHHRRPLTILNQTITGNTAAQKIDNLFEHSIEHPEALANLPVIIVQGMADDNLSEAKKQQLRAAWASMGANKQFLEFIQAYAVSTLFHSPSQFKYATSVERNLYLANKSYLTNTEALLDRMRIEQRLNDEDVRIFEPVNVVFGGQTSAEAADSGLVFERHVNSSSFSLDRYTNGANCIAANETFRCDFGDDWLKDWGRVIPTQNGRYGVEQTARWLWERYVGSTRDYGEVERAYLLALLGGSQIESDPQTSQRRMMDFVHLMCVRQRILDTSQNKDVSLSRLRSPSGFGQHCRGSSGRYSAAEQALMSRIYSRDEITNTPHIQTLLSELGAQNLELGPSASANQKLYANQRIQHAIAFIAATPYLFVEGIVQGEPAL